MKLFIRTIGIDRATTKIGMANLVYNLSRYVWHQAVLRQHEAQAATTAPHQ